MDGADLRSDCYHPEPPAALKMPAAPEDFAALLRQFESIREDIALVRALRNAKIITADGEAPIRWDPASDNAVFDLRDLASTEETSGAAEFIGCKVVKSSTQATPNATNVLVTFQSAELTSSTGIFDGSTKLIVPQSGVYEVAATLAWDVNGAGYRFAGILQNGTLVARSEVAPTTDFTVHTVSTILSLVGGDYLQVRGYQNSSGSLDLAGTANASFSIALLGSL